MARAKMGWPGSFDKFTVAGAQEEVELGGRWDWRMTEPPRSLKWETKGVRSEFGRHSSGGSDAVR